MNRQLPVVMVDGTLPESLRELLAGQVELVAWIEPGDTVRPEVDGLLTYGHPLVDDSMLARLPNLRVISNHGVGVDHIEIAACERRQIPVGNTPAILDGAVADLAFALLLAAARRLPESIRVAAAAETTEFDPNALHGQEVHGRTLGIVGLGRIGRALARRAAGFEMPVVYHNRRPLADGDLPANVRYLTLPDLMAAADFIVICVPLHAGTLGLIGAAELARVKPSAVLVNVARGPVVDTEALLAALDSGRLWAAALDVTDPEPLPRNHPLLNHPRALITSHIGSATLQTRRKMAELTVENLLRGLAGNPLIAQV